MLSAIVIGVTACATTFSAIVYPIPFLDAWNFSLDCIIWLCQQYLIIKQLVGLLK